MQAVPPASAFMRSPAAVACVAGSNQRCSAAATAMARPLSSSPSAAATLGSVTPACLRCALVAGKCSCCRPLVAGQTIEWLMAHDAVLDDRCNSGASAVHWAAGKGMWCVHLHVHVMCDGCCVPCPKRETADTVERDQTTRCVHTGVRLRLGTRGAGARSWGWGLVGELCDGEPDGFEVPAVLRTVAVGYAGLVVAVTPFAANPGP